MIIWLQERGEVGGTMRWRAARHRRNPPGWARIRSQVRWPRVHTYILYDSRTIATLGSRNARWYSLCVDHIPLPCLETLLFLRLFHLTHTYVPPGPFPTVHGPSLLACAPFLTFFLSPSSYALIQPDLRFWSCVTADGVA